MDFGNPPSGEIPILFNDHHVYANPDTLRQGRVLAALVKKGTLMVPLRSMFEQMGATVSYDAAGKSVKYIAQQAGHASAGFTLDRYGHLFETVPTTPTEWPEDILWPGGCPCLEIVSDLATTSREQTIDGEPLTHQERLTEQGLQQ